MKPSTRCLIQCQANPILVDLTSACHCLSLLAGGPKSGTLFKHILKRPLEIGLMEKAAIFLYVTMATQSIVYSYKKGSLCRGH